MFKRTYRRVLAKETNSEKKCEHVWIGVILCTKETSCEWVGFLNGFWQCSGRRCAHSRRKVVCQKCFIERKD